MGPLERHLEQLLVNFPNLVNSYLWGRKFSLVKEFGKINVCVRQGKLPECNGQIDLAFITESHCPSCGIETPCRVRGHTSTAQTLHRSNPGMVSESPHCRLSCWTPMSRFAHFESCTQQGTGEHSISGSRNTPKERIAAMRELRRRIPL